MSSGVSCLACTTDSAGHMTLHCGTA
jgi:hypothetical protein